MFLVGIIILTLGAELGIKGIRLISEIFQLPESVLGLTLAAISTSLPEIMISLFTIITPEIHPQIAFDNAISSFIFQGSAAMLILATLKEFKFSKKIRKDLEFALILAFLLFIFSLDHYFSRIEGFLLIIAYFIYLRTAPKEKFGKRERIKNIWQLIADALEGIMSAVSGLILLLVGSEIAIHGAIKIANYLGLSNSIAGVLLGVGTSLPEVVLSSYAIRKRMNNFAISNLIGSNILVISFPIGILSLFRPFSTSIFFSFYVLAIAFFDWILLKDGDLQRWEALFISALSIPYLLFLL